MNEIKNQNVDGIIRLLLGMVILYQSDKGEDLNLDKLAKELETATGDGFFADTLRSNIAHAVKLCPYEEMVGFFNFRIER
jgi:hypothetical protein